MINCRLSSCLVSLSHQPSLQFLGGGGVSRGMSAMLCQEGCFKGSSERFFVGRAHKILVSGPARCWREKAVCFLRRGGSLTGGRFSQPAAADDGRADGLMDYNPCTCLLNLCNPGVFLMSVSHKGGSRQAHLSDRQTDRRMDGVCAYETKSDGRSDDFLAEGSGGGGVGGVLSWKNAETNDVVIIRVTFGGCGNLSH